MNETLMNCLNTLILAIIVATVAPAIVLAMARIWGYGVSAGKHRFRQKLKEDSNGEESKGRTGRDGPECP